MTPRAWSDLDVRRALGLPLEGAGDALRFPGISTDSRTLAEGELFLALTGEHFDGHDFLEAAFERGAAGAIVSRAPAGVPGGRRREIYVVPDTLEALGALANFGRRASPVRVVAITGSSGKTTTKELVRAALAPAFRVHATTGNLNNRIGLPLTILQAPADAEILVLEMGTSEPGEIATLTRIAAPDVGVVTTVGDAHLEGLGSREGVLREKLALAEGTSPGGLVVVGDEPEALPHRARELRPDARVAGWSERADPGLRPGAAEMDEAGRWTIGWEGQSIRLGLPGRHGVSNALLALAVARHFGVSAPDAARAVEGVIPTGMRGETVRVGGLTLILDCYNANPQSVDAALDLLAALPAPGARVAVLGSMLELGEASGELHRRVLGGALARPLELVVASGEFHLAAGNGSAGEPGDAPRLIRAAELAEAYAALRDRLRGDEVILLKGSRGAQVESLLPLFERDFGGGA